MIFTTKIGKFISENKDWESILIKEPYCLKIQRYDGYILFKYNQINSDFSNPIVQEARGIIFKEGYWEVPICHAFDKFFNVGESNAVDIDWSTAMVSQKVDGCFTYWDKVLLSDGTCMEIGKIVRHKLPVEVLSYNFYTHSIESKKVCGWKKSTQLRPTDDFLTINLKGTKTSLNGKLSQHCVITPTKNHLFYIKDVCGNFQEVQAQELKESDILITPYYDISQIEKQIILGTVLGDSSFTYYQLKNYFNCKSLRFTQGRHQKSYAYYKHDCLPNLHGKITEKLVSANTGYNNVDTVTYNYTCPTNEALYNLYNLVYKNGKKMITKELLDNLTYISLAFWYMDDGSLDKAHKSNSIFLHTEAFSYEEHLLLQEFFNNKGLTCTIRKSKGYYYLHFNYKASEIIFQNIRQYICPSMYYKLPERHQGYFNNNFINEIKEQPLQISIRESYISKIQDGLHCHNYYNSKNLYVYDIEVEDNHNYFCQGVLVHNSLIKLWYNDNHWHISTNGMIDAYQACYSDIEECNFGNLFKEALKNNNLTFEELTKNLTHGYTYMFELVSPKTRVVIPYEKTDLYYLGCRDNFTNVEWPFYTVAPDITTPSNIKTPTLYSLNSIDKCLKAAQNLPWDEEGYVVCDINCNRVKIKSPQYVLAHYVRGNGKVSNETLVSVAVSGEDEEFLTYASDYTEALHKVTNAIKKFKNDCVEALHNVKQNTYSNRKEYALAVQKYPENIRPYLFKNIDNEISIDDFTKDWDSKKWLKYIEV